MTDEQCIVGVTRHQRTGAYIVWMSLEGNDVTPVGAWRSEATATAAMEETAEEYHRLADAMENAAPEQAEQVGLDHWIAFIEDMKQRSDTEPTPFPDSQLAEMGRGIAALLKQRQQVPTSPEGFARVLRYSDAALAGLEMPRVRLTPMPLPPKKRKG